MRLYCSVLFSQLRYSSFSHLPPLRELSPSLTVLVLAYMWMYGSISCCSPLCDIIKWIRWIRWWKLSVYEWTIWLVGSLSADWLSRLLLAVLFYFCSMNMGSSVSACSFMPPVKWQTTAKRCLTMSDCVTRITNELTLGLEIIPFTGVRYGWIKRFIVMAMPTTWASVIKYQLIGHNWKGWMKMTRELREWQTGWMNGWRNILWRG